VQASLRRQIVARGFVLSPPPKPRRPAERKAQRSAPFTYPEARTVTLPADLISLLHRAVRGNETLEHKDGTAQTADPDDVDQPKAQLSSISCVQMRNCVAAGCWTGSRRARRDPQQIYDIPSRVQNPESGLARRLGPYQTSPSSCQHSPNGRILASHVTISNSNILQPLCAVCRPPILAARAGRDASIAMALADGCQQRRCANHNALVMRRKCWGFE